MWQVAEHKSGKGRHLFEHIKLTDRRTTLGPIGPPPPAKYEMLITEGHIQLE